MIPRNKEEKGDEWEDIISGARMEEMNDKIDSGEITCNLDSPEDCEACGS